MKTFEIREEGTRFAKIEARTAESSLNKAARQFPRRSGDYNGYVGPITWSAFLPDEPYALAAKELKVRK